MPFFFMLTGLRTLIDPASAAVIASVRNPFPVTDGADAETPQHIVRMAPQAFRANGRAWAVQFHPEVRRDQVLRWFQGDELVTRPLDEIVSELDEKLGTWQERGRRLCRAFLAVAQS